MRLPCYIPKSGNKVVVDIDNNTAMSLEAVQTPSVKELRQAGKTLITHYSSIVIERKDANLHYLYRESQRAKKAVFR